MKLFLIDAYALIYRSYYAFIKNPRINSKGMNTSAIFGFINSLEDVLKRENPTHIAVGFDPKGPTFRHEAYEQYKAQRQETPEDIRKSVPFIKDIIEAYNIPILEVPRYEADDVIARNGRAALGELDEAVGKSLHHDAVLALFTHGNGGAGLARLAGDGHGGVALGLLLLIESLELVADAVDGLLRREAAVADGGIHIVEVAEAGLFEQRGAQLVPGDSGDGDAVMLELGFKGSAAVDDVLLALFLLEPLLDLDARLV